ncbi:MAG: hypothetical protein M0C28_07670 [Candidatus Moduliflexus flocculans]|nr:hypothetical protein [Candidatus Moduliflexus flocculans]
MRRGLPLRRHADRRPGDDASTRSWPRSRRTGSSTSSREAASRSPAATRCVQPAFAEALLDACAGRGIHDGRRHGRDVAQRRPRPAGRDKADLVLYDLEGAWTTPGTGSSPGVSNAPILENLKRLAAGRAGDLGPHPARRPASTTTTTTSGGRSRFLGSLKTVAPGRPPALPLRRPGEGPPDRPRIAFPEIRDPRPRSGSRPSRPPSARPGFEVRRGG